MEIKNLCVYCGSSVGKNPVFKETAIEFGKHLAGEGIQLVYGGGNVGLMGAIADGCLEAGGTVTGVIPEDLLAKELGHKGIQNLEVVANMHERKHKMASLADAFVAMPGGIGTMEEIFEVYTWFQLQFHTKPCGLLNVEGYYDHLIRFLQHSVEERFLIQPHLDALIVESDISELLKKLKNAAPLKDTKWWD
ncbi:MAG: TIGR00730 family Rossman fold protein [Opitutales bacterium]|nr:TIGR00730 family Rossman fold protein [Opitutales bacterium]